ncbi:MAG: hypothetical protein ABIW79_07240 [Gemmatimonas sp.]
MSAFFQLEDDAPARRMLLASALLLVFVPTVQAVSQIWPLQLTNIQWRFFAANALSSILLLPFLGLVLLLVLARMVASRRLAMTVAIASAVLTILLLVSMVLFVLDGLQLKAIITSAQMAMFKNQFARVLLVTSMFVVTFAMLALASFKTPRGLVAASRRNAPKEAEEGADLIVGRA